MLPTFVIGLREGLEAALIVGIVAAFLKQRGRQDLLRLAMLGVAAAVTICLILGITLEVVSRNLPQRQQEGLETVIGFIAVAMVTYMVIWMKRHSRDLRGQLEGAAAAAVASGSGMALVLMAFLAVLREGFETAVFLIAAFNESDSGASAGVGAVLGVALAIVLGYGIYRGGVRINLSKFFRATGLVLVLVAAGLVVTGLHTAHEAGWLNAGQQQTLDLTGITRPGSVQASLLTGMLGIQDRPTRIEVIGWLVYLLPLSSYVLWPAGRAVPRAALRRLTFAAAGIAALAAILLAVTTPSVTGTTDSLTIGSTTLTTQASGGTSVLTITAGLQPAGTNSADPPTGRYPASSSSLEEHDGVATRRYVSAATAVAPDSALPKSASLAQVAALNGGRLPLGFAAPGSTPVVPSSTSVASGDASAAGAAALSYTTQRVLSWWVQPQTSNLIDAAWQDTTAVTARSNGGAAAALGTARTTTVTLPADVSSKAAAATRHQLARSAARHTRRTWAGTLLAAALAGALLAMFGFRRRAKSSAPAGHDDTIRTANSDVVLTR